MLSGVVTGRMPPEPVALQVGDPVSPAETGGATGSGWQRGEAPPSLVLTPKGRILGELRLLRIEEGEAGTLKIEGPGAAREGLLALFGQVLPPRFARVEEVDPPVRCVTLVGPQGPELLAQALGSVTEAAAFAHDGTAALYGAAAPLQNALASLAPGGVLTHHGSGMLHVIRSDMVAPVALDLLGSEAQLDPLIQALRAAGVSQAPDELWTVLRIEHGRPEFGCEFDGDTLPPEAGLEQRMVDHTKGCYTGQEVIVRIRDRGKVNRHLRGITLRDGLLPAPGTPLFAPDRERAVGEIRSASPSFHPSHTGSGVALGYVRHEIEPPAEVHLGSPEGPRVVLHRLTPEGWLHGDTSL
jgi:folate-binding protein YgfZ